MKSVLVVEDDTIVNMYAAEELRGAGYRVLTAPSADDAIALLEEDPEIHVVFTDIDMPGSMDGLKLAAAVRNRWPPIKIIVTTGQAAPASDDLPQDSIFIPKPYNLQRLVDVVNRCVS
jgi:CheY-like chemotaxis protein